MSAKAKQAEATTEGSGAAPEPPKGLHAKLAEIVQDVENVSKDGHNDHFNYDYATAENMLRELRKPLADRGIVLLPSICEITERQAKTARGGNTTITTVQMNFEFIDSETDERYISRWAGSGDDPSDKGLYKAYTGAIKTFLREAFLLPVGDDPEADQRADKRAEAGEESQEASAPDTLNDEQAERLLHLIDGAGLTDHMATKLRSFGVSNLLELTTDQAIAMHEWVQGAKGDG